MLSSFTCDPVDLYLKVTITKGDKIQRIGHTADLEGINLIFFYNLKVFVQRNKGTSKTVESHKKH